MRCSRRTRAELRALIEDVAGSTAHRHQVHDADGRDGGLIYYQALRQESGS